ncbi:MAG: flavodoxin-dependent (E)-4-hydroxy-3-methylbut-2-enyl-diphosphate synthase [Acidobacteriota bacterium]
MITRRKTRKIYVGSVPIGGDAPISVQSMTKTDTRNVKETLSQIFRLKEAGCEIVRVSVPDKESVRALKEIKKESPLPVIADIHFNHRLALESIENGADCLRINPGNIGDKEKLKTIIKSAKNKEISIRIGINSGSLEKHILKKYGATTAEAMVESALNNIKFFEDMDFRDIKISIKASDVERTVKAYRLLGEKVDYPFHVGITEAGTYFSGTIKSSIGIGILLYEGIGDTIRVSLTSNPEEEVKVAWEILKSLGLRKRGVEIVSCPTCSRLEVNLIPIVSEIERRLANLDYPLHLAIMGCVVNGPGEASEAEIGLACGKGVGLIYRKGEIQKKVKEDEMIDELIKTINIYLKEKTIDFKIL